MPSLLTDARALALALSLLAAVPAAAPAATGAEPAPSAPACQEAELAKRLAVADASTKGRLGVCVLSSALDACVHGDERFPMQSVVKLLTGIAALDAVDDGTWALDHRVHVTKSDLSVFVQPLAEEVGPDGLDTTVLDLVERAIIQSDNAANDILIDRLGGPDAVQRRLRAKKIDGVRVDRTERDLQSEIAGIAWRPEFADPERFREAIEGLSPEARSRAYAAYRADGRDTATPRGMAELLLRLARGTLLEPESNDLLIEILLRTQTGQDRLRAGVPEGWQVAHKTGTSSTWDSLTAATNDVGLLRSPDGHWIAVAAFLADSPEPSAERSAVLALAARFAADAHRKCVAGE